MFSDKDIIIYISPRIMQLHVPILSISFIKSEFVDSTIAEHFCFDFTVIADTRCLVNGVNLNFKTCSLSDIGIRHCLTIVVIRHSDSIRGSTQPYKATRGICRIRIDGVKIGFCAVTGSDYNLTVIDTVAANGSRGHRQENRQCVYRDYFVGAGGAAITVRHLHTDRVFTNSRPAHVLHIGSRSVTRCTTTIGPFVVIQVCRGGRQGYRRQEIGTVLTDHGIAANLRYRNRIHDDLHRPVGNTLRIVINYSQRKVSRTSIRPRCRHLFAVRIDGSTWIVRTPTIGVCIGCPIRHLLYCHCVSIQRSIGTHFHRSGKDQCQRVIHIQHIATR